MRLIQKDLACPGGTRMRKEGKLSGRRVQNLKRHQKLGHRDNLFFSHFLSRWKSHTIKPAHLECLVQWVSVESQAYATITSSPELDKLFSFFLAAPHDLWDLSFLTSDLNPGSLHWQVDT